MPVTVKEHPGVLLFFAREPAQNPTVQFALQSIGAHVGQFAECCRSNQDLYEERRRLSQAQRIARVGSWEWDVESDVVSWSDTMFELYGVDPDRFTANEANPRCIHPDDLQAVGDTFSQVPGHRAGHGLAVPSDPPRGRRDPHFRGPGEALPEESGRPGRVVGTAMDITEQVEAQRESAGREGMLRAILANSQSLIYVKDLEGRYLLVNEPLLQARSLSEADLLGKDDSTLDPELAPVWRANDLRAQEGEYRVEEYFDTPDGRLYYDTVKFPLFNAEGRLFAVGGISLDVTAARRAAAVMTEAGTPRWPPTQPSRPSWPP